MISFRRGLLPSIHDRSLQNGSALSTSNHAPISAAPATGISFPATTVPISTTDPFSTNDKDSPPFSWLKQLHKKDTCDRSRLKGGFWRRPFLPILLCFFVGFLVGLTPLSSPSSSHYKSVEGEEGSSLELTSTVNREGQVEVVRADAVTGDSSSVAKLAATLPSQNFTTSQLLDPSFGKLLIVVTPTYNRALQALYLTRLSHTLKLVPPPLLWLVVEMSTQTSETANILRKTGIMYRHLVCKKNMTDVKDRGVYQRNTALEHIEQHQLDGIVYFADDDNVYTLELFEQMRLIRRFGTWPVAMLTAGKSKTILEGPVCDGQTVIGWHTNDKSKRLRRFHVDMSGFAFNSTILWDPARWHKPTVEPIRQLDNVKEGLQETTFIEQLVEDESQMEGLPSGCSKIMVWHLHFEVQEAYPPGWKRQDDLNATILL